MRKYWLCLAALCVTVGCGSVHDAPPPVGVSAGSNLVTTQVSSKAELSDEEKAGWEFVGKWYAADVAAFLDAWHRSEVLAFLEAWHQAEARPVPVRPAAPSRARATTPAANYSGGDPFLNCVMNRESRGNPGAVNSSSGAAGLFQYLPSTWAALGYAKKYGVPTASMATPAQQWEAARDTLARVGRSPWAGPGC